MVHDLGPAPASVEAAPSRATDATPSRSTQVLAAVEVLHELCDLDRIARVALRLVYWQGLDHAEVADRLGLTRVEVSRAVARGMRQLAGRLERPGELM